MISAASHRTEGVLALLMIQVFPQFLPLFPSDCAFFPQPNRSGSSSPHPSVEITGPSKQWVDAGGNALQSKGAGVMWQAKALPAQGSASSGHTLITLMRGFDAAAIGMASSLGEGTGT